MRNDQYHEFHLFCSIDRFTPELSKIRRCGVLRFEIVTDKTVRGEFFHDKQTKIAQLSGLPSGGKR